MRNRTSVRILPVAFLLTAFFVPTTSWAGPNEGGTLILHAARPFAEGTVSCLFCSNDPACGGVLDCDVAETRVDGTEAGPVILYVYAAFAPDARPRVMSVVFGIDYDPGLPPITSADFHSCADFNVEEPDWPDSGTGTALQWESVREDPLQLMCVFSLYEYASYGGGAPAEFCLTQHPSQGGYFADDSIPAEIDAVAAYGCIGFGKDGSLPCPPAAVPSHETSWGQIKATYR